MKGTDWRKEYERLERKFDKITSATAELKAKLVQALCRCGSPKEASRSLHVPSCEYWKVMGNQ